MCTAQPSMIRPERIQLSRKKGWRLPPNTISVSRPGKWGNPFSVAEYGRELAVRNFRNRLVGLIAIGALDLSELRGKNLACWCRMGESCHADVLLEMANAPCHGWQLKNEDRGAHCLRCFP